MNAYEFITRMKRKQQRDQLIEIGVVLAMTSILFYSLETNMMVFGFFVYGGLIWMIIKAPNRKLSLLTGMAGGIIGGLTEYWGCANHLWNWVTPCKSIWMINGQSDGFPIEVVVAYFGAGFWISKVSAILFDEEHRKNIEFIKNKAYKNRLGIRLIIAVVVDVIGLWVIITEPVYIQSVLLFMAGINILLFLSKPAMVVVGGMALFMGMAGFFFENFATGFFDSFAVWRYSVSAHSNLNLPIPFIGVAPYSAFVAYTGTGMILFGLSFLLDRDSI